MDHIYLSKRTTTSWPFHLRVKLRTILLIYNLLAIKMFWQKAIFPELCKKSSSKGLKKPRKALYFTM